MLCFQTRGFYAFIGTKPERTAYKSFTVFPRSHTERRNEYTQEQHSLYYITT